jgi:Flp pilus assembly protein TadG
MAALEFALWLTPIILMLGGIIEVSRMLSIHHTVARAARDGARIGVAITRSASGTGPATETDIENEAVTHATRVLDDTGLTCDAGCVVTANWFEGQASSFYLLTVRVEYPFTPLTGLIPGMDQPVAREFTMLTQYQPG